MEQPEKPPSNEANVVRALRIATSRTVAPLTDTEILALRRMLADFEAIKKGCPIARRALSER